MRRTINTDRESIERLIVPNNRYPDNIIFADGKIMFQEIDFTGRQDFKITLNGKLRKLALRFENCNFTPSGSHPPSLQLNSLRNPNIDFFQCKAPRLTAHTVPSLVIKDCVFEQTDFNKVENLVLTDTSFRDCAIQGCRLPKGLQLKELKEISNLSIITSYFEQPLSIQGCFIELLSLKDLANNDQEIKIKGNDLKKEAHISACTLKALSIEKNRGNQIRLNTVTAPQVALNNNSNDVTIEGCKFDTVVFKENSGNKAELNNCTIDKKLSFENNTWENIELSNQDLSLMSFSGNCSKISFKDSFGKDFPSLEDNNFSEISIAHSKKAGLEWNFKYNGPKCPLTLYNLKLKKIAIDFHELSRLNVNNCDFDEIKITGGKVEQLDIEHSVFNLELVGNQIDHLRMAENRTKENCLWVKTKYLGTTHILQTALHEFKIEDCSAKYISIDSTGLTHGRSHSFHVDRLKSEKLVVMGENLGQIDFLNCEISTVDFQTSGISKIRLQNINAQEVIIGSKKDEEGSMPVIWRFRDYPTQEFVLDQCAKIERFELIQNFKRADEDGFPFVKHHFNESNIDTLYSGRLFIGLIDSNKCTYSKIDFSNDLETGGTLHVKLSCDTIKKIDLRETVSMQELSIKKTKIDEANISPRSLNSLNITECPLDAAEFSIKKLIATGPGINSIDVTNSAIGLLEFHKISPKTFHIAYVSLGDFLLNSFKVNGTSEMNFVNTDRSVRSNSVNFIDTNLSGMNFNSCYFDTFQHLEVRSSKVDEIKCTATTWPKAVTSSYIENKKKKQRQFEIREACRQLKLAMASHQDRVSELQFHALEMTAYRKIVMERGWHWRNWNDVISLLAGATNMFGLNWVLPFFLAFALLTANFWLLICVQYDIQVTEVSQVLHCISWEEYFKIYNPTHSFDFPGSMSFGTASLDFLSRFLSAFFIYQVVVAFRKYRK